MTVRAWSGGLCLLVVLALQGCGPRTPKGQVVAVVNGQEITLLDLAAEARASGVQGQPDRRALLQRVVARVLLAQSAHDRKLDRYPGYPSDVARLEQTLLADKAIRASVKPPAKPSSLQIDQFIAAHPYVFKDRSRVTVDVVQFRSTDPLKTLSGATGLPSIMSRLSSLDIQYNHQTRTLDTAELPPVLAQRLTTVAPGHLFFVRDGETILAMEVENRNPVSSPEADERALATQLISQAAVQQQVAREVNQLRSRAKVTYQAGYAPVQTNTPARAPQ